MTAQEFYLKNPEYIQRAKLQEMKAILSKRILTLSDVKSFFSHTNRPKDYIKQRMEQISKEFNGNFELREKYGYEMAYILESFKSEMNLIINKI